MAFGCGHTVSAVHYILCAYTKRLGNLLVFGNLSYVCAVCCNSYTNVQLINNKIIQIFRCLNIQLGFNHSEVKMLKDHLISV